MVLRYSYKTELKRYEAKKLSLAIANLNNPADEKIKEKIELVSKQIAWLKKKKKKGEDPGVRIV